MVTGGDCSDRSLSDLDRSCPDKNVICRCKKIDSSIVLCCQVKSQFLFHEGIGCAGASNSNTTDIIIRNSTLDVFDISKQRLQMQRFTISGSSIRRLSGQFRGNTLTYVNLSSLGLSEISQDAFNNLLNLRTLDLSNNNLTKLPEIPYKGHSISLDISNNRYLMCSSMSDLIAKWQNNNDSISFNNYNNSYCSSQRSFNWFNSTDLVPLSQVEILTKQLSNKQVEDCPTGKNYSCRCSASRLDMVAGMAPKVTVQVDCSNQYLTSLPDTLPPNTNSLNVTNNHIVSLEPLVNSLTYQNVREFYADNNQIESISVLEGTHFIVNFVTLSLRGNRLRSIPTYFLSSTFDRNLYERYVKLGNNKLKCDCTTATALKTFLLTHQAQIPDYYEVLCDKDNTKVINLQPEVMCVNYIPKKWTDYIYYIIAGELFLLVALVSKVFYDYWVFKSTGYLPWPASRMPKLPCDWVFE